MKEYDHAELAGTDRVKRLSKAEKAAILQQLNVTHEIRGQLAADMTEAFLPKRRRLQVFYESPEEERT